MNLMWMEMNFGGHGLDFQNCFPAHRYGQLLAVGLRVKMCRERPLDFSFRKMTEKLEQRYCIKVCYYLGDTQVETIPKIQQAFGDKAMSRPTSRIKEWYNRFKNVRTSVDSEPRSGKP